MQAALWSAIHSILHSTCTRLLLARFTCSYPLGLSWLSTFERFIAHAGVLGDTTTRVMASSILLERKDLL